MPRVGARDAQPALTDLWVALANFVPRALTFLAILAFGWIVARFTLRLVAAALARTRWERLAGPEAAGDLLRRARHLVDGLLPRLAHLAVVLVTLRLAFEIWGPNPVSVLLEEVLAWLPRALVAVVIVAVAVLIARAARDLVGGLLGDGPSARPLGRALSAFIVMLGTVAALSHAGIATTVTQPLLIALLAAATGVFVVGVGGGLVRPMQRRWDRWLRRPTPPAPPAPVASPALPGSSAPLASPAPVPAGPAVPTSPAPDGPAPDAPEPTPPTPPVWSPAAGGPGTGGARSPDPVRIIPPPDAADRTAPARDLPGAADA
ncbi:hypothetical protein AB0J86_15630 [Micromonospora sp. NPDC049559]|uniref:mechanosensitive ion channel family protein n=1 Tax=Micromonospora sp. NPDC049559 TaxID=3155923 RepID=UPI003430B902